MWESPYRLTATDTVPVCSIRMRIANLITRAASVGLKLAVLVCQLVRGRELNRYPSNFN